jgi:hypothetical protein
MRKLLALGLSKDEILALYFHVKGHRAARLVARDDSTEAGAPDERLEQAREYIRKLIALGFAESDIADLCALSPPTITKVLDPHEARVLSAEAIERLREVVNQAGRRRLTDVLPDVPVLVLETCCNKGQALDLKTDEVIAQRSRDVLIDVLLGLPSQEAVAAGIAAVLLQVGNTRDGVHVIVAPCRDDGGMKARLAQLEAMEHEAKHLVRLCQAEREKLERLLGVQTNHPTPRAHA